MEVTQMKYTPDRIETLQDTNKVIECRPDVGCILYDKCLDCPFPICVQQLDNYRQGRIVKLHKQGVPRSQLVEQVSWFTKQSQWFNTVLGEED
jgi:hypothetical protein